MSKHHTSSTTPAPEAGKKEVDTSRKYEKKEKVTGETKEKVGETLKLDDKAMKAFQEEMKGKFGEHPTQGEVLATLMTSETFKEVKNFDEAMKILKQGDEKKGGVGKHEAMHEWIMHNAKKEENKTLRAEAENIIKKSMGESNFNALSPGEKELRIEGEIIEMKKKPSKKPATDAEIDKDLAERGYGPTSGKEKKKIADNKSADLSGFSIGSKEKLQPGDIIVAQTGIAGENPIFRWNEKSKMYKSINHADKYAGGQVLKEKMQALQEEHKWHEVSEKDIKEETEKKSDTSTTKTKKPEEKKVEKFTEEPKPEPEKKEKSSSGKGFFGKAGSALARPFKKTRQATKRTGKTARRATKFVGNSAIATVKTAGKTLWLPVGWTSHVLGYKSFKEGTKAWAEDYKKYRSFKK